VSAHGATIGRAEPDDAVEDLVGFQYYVLP